jgi:hypothetical protein
MDEASKKGDLSLLNKLFYVDSNRKYSEDAINYASILGHVEVLEWWKIISELFHIELKYNSYAIDYASMKGHIDVLEWWKNSGLPLKYTTKALEEGFNDDVKEWWLYSGLKLKFK